MWSMTTTCRAAARRRSTVRLGAPVKIVFEDDDGVAAPPSAPLRMPLRGWRRRSSPRPGCCIRERRSRARRDGRCAQRPGHVGRRLDDGSLAAAHAGDNQGPLRGLQRLGDGVGQRLRIASANPAPAAPPRRAHAPPRNRGAPDRRAAAGRSRVAISSSRVSSTWRRTAGRAPVAPPRAPRGRSSAECRIFSGDLQRLAPHRLAQRQRQPRRGIGHVLAQHQHRVGDLHLVQRRRAGRTLAQNIETEASRRAPARTRRGRTARRRPACAARSSLRATRAASRCR